jgi:hypothetical protein
MKRHTIEKGGSQSLTLVKELSPLGNGDRRGDYEANVLVEGGLNPGEPMSGLCFEEIVGETSRCELCRRWMEPKPSGICHRCEGTTRLRRKT